MSILCKSCPSLRTDIIPNTIKTRALCRKYSKILRNKMPQSDYVYKCVECLKDKTMK
jgi:hypothetical protein